VKMETQDDKDWEAFEKVFKKREGFSPTKRDSKVKELFFWFTCGAHCEHLGQLNIKTK
jgi:hypothetical protein